MLQWAKRGLQTGLRSFGFLVPKNFESPTQDDTCPQLCLAVENSILYDLAFRISDINLLKDYENIQYPRI